MVIGDRADERALQETYWLAIPEAHARYDLRATGSPGTSWYAYCLEHLPADRRARARMLSLGCGGGDLERDLHALGAFRECVGIDRNVDAARTAAATLGGALSYATGDLNAIRLPAAAYTAVWCNMTLGRIRDVDRLVRQIAQSLEPGGMLFANEYVGANRYAFPRAQREAIDAAFSLVPRRFRRPAGKPDAPPLARAAVPHPAGGEPEEWEPVASADILPAIRKHLDLIEVRPIGGTILQFLLSGIAGNFNSESPSAKAVLTMLFAIEDALVDTGELGSDFALVVARRREEP